MITLTTLAAFFSKFGTTIFSFLKDSWPFIKKHWKNILLIGFLIWVIYIACSLFNDKAIIEKEFKEFKAIKTEELNSREKLLNQIIKDYKDTIALKDFKIDSFDAAIALKGEQLKNINNEVQILSGDSVAIVKALNGVFSKKR